MTELFIYRLYQNILNQSHTMQGRFVALRQYGNDLNASNFAQLLTDELGRLLPNSQKYPCVAMLPPMDVMPHPVAQGGWATYKMQLFFLTQEGQKGEGGFKNPNPVLNASGYTTLNDWADMRQCAGDFMTILKNLNIHHATNGLQLQYRYKQDTPEVYQRYCLQSNDRVNGIKLTFEAQLYTNPCTIIDYDTDVVVEIPH
jgi:hypothetical protein